MTTGSKQDVFSLPEGGIVLQWPDPLTLAGYEDFESQVQLVLRKGKRSVKEAGQRKRPRTVVDATLGRVFG